jgi:hypothetical protein
MRYHECGIGNVYKSKTMKRRALLLLTSVGLSPILFSSCSGVGGTAENGTSSSPVATAGSGGVQWTGGNYVSSTQPELSSPAEIGTRSNVEPTAGSDGVQWTGGNYVSNTQSQ